VVATTVVVETVTGTAVVSAVAPTVASVAATLSAVGPLSPSLHPDAIVATLNKTENQTRPTLEA
jgi:hypothetical protein